MKDKCMNNENLINPLAKARGLGSTHHGAEQWLAERISAAVLLPLIGWLVWSVVHMDHDYATFTTWLHQPVNAILMIITLLPMLYHSAYGLQVVIEDYVHCSMLRLCSIIGVKLVSLALAIACIFSILKIAFT
jgi:succinate dehydrogenase / fumarate reductase membrane anchor subunit